MSDDWLRWDEVFVAPADGDYALTWRGKPGTSIGTAGIHVRLHAGATARVAYFTDVDGQQSASVQVSVNTGPAVEATTP